MITLPIPAEALKDCGAILGRRGAGKSGTGRAILEHELDAQHRCCVIDPKGDWYGIRAKKDGSPSRFEIPVFGGAHADVPIDDSMGAQLGEIVATSSTSSIIDLSGFSRAGMLRFMLGFAEALFMHNRQPLTLMVDEADQLAPQRVPAEVAKVLHFMEALIRQGRQRGIFMWMLTQRPAVINKNLLSQAETLIAMKMTGPQDRKAIRDWMDAHDPERAAEVEKDLAQLSVGQAWAWVPGADFLERVQFPLFETYDSGRTPQHGETVGDVALAPLDMGAIAAALNPERADEQSEEERLSAEVARLRRRVEQLQRELDIETRRTAEHRAEAQRYLALVVAVQDLLGMHVGSARIEPLPAGADPNDYVMLGDHDDVVRPFPKSGEPGRRMQGLRRMQTEADNAAAELALERQRAGIAALAEGKVLGEVAGDVPAVRRIVAAVALAGPIGRDALPELADVSPTSSHMGVGLRRLVERGVLRQVGERYALADERTGG